MRVAKYLWMLTVAFALMMIGCEEPDSPTPPSDNTEQKGDQENQGDENQGDENQGGENQGGKDMEWKEPLPEATYALAGRITASDFLSFSDGRRNDYISFYDEITFHTLYIDLYTAESNTIVPEGRYPLADNFDNAAYREYTYLSLIPNGELYRFTDGWVEVMADENDPSGYTLHKIRAYFTMESGETVSLDYTGTIITNS